MNRKELIEKMERVYRAVPGYVIQNGLSAVLDMLTKETVVTRRNSACQTVDGCDADFNRGNSGPEVSIIILDLPVEPTVGAQAARIIADALWGAKVVDGIDADVLTGAAEQGWRAGLLHSDRAEQDAGLPYRV